MNYNKIKNLIKISINKNYLIIQKIITWKMIYNNFKMLVKII